MLAIFVWGLLASQALADSDHCAVCGSLFSTRVFTVQDSVTEEKKQVCPDCAALTTVCFICGMPAKTNYTALPDLALYPPMKTAYASRL